MTAPQAYRIERSPSSRARCRTCGATIARGALRFGVPHERPSGLTHLWHHLACAAAHRRAEVEAAAAAGAVPEGLAPLPLDELAARERSRAGHRPAEVPHIERAQADGARCASCGGEIERGALFVALARLDEHRGVLRSSPISVHLGCTAAALRAEDCAVDPDGLDEAVRRNSHALPAVELEAALRAIVAAAGES